MKGNHNARQFRHEGETTLKIEANFPLFLRAGRLSEYNRTEIIVDAPMKKTIL